MNATPNTQTETPHRTGFLTSFIRWLVIGVAFLWSLAVLILVAVRWIDRPPTAVHMQRRLQAWIRRKPYRERYKFIPLSQISPDLEHAVIAAEDAHFYRHMDSINTRSKSLLKTIWKANALAELPP
jgi:monofunctional glycosyltransferase